MSFSLVKTFVYFIISGRIKAIQLDYSEAHKNLLQAIRKAPESSGVGFRQTVSSFSACVILM